MIATAAPPPTQAPVPSFVAALAHKGYLPLTITSRGRARWKIPLPPAIAAVSRHWSWRSPHNPAVRGALYAFEKANGLPLAGPGKGDKPPSDVSAKLRHGAGVASPWIWSWIVVHRAKHGETAALYHLQGGKLRKTFTTPVNTGAIQRTPLGTWPIYSRSRTTTMQGSALFPVPKGLAKRLRAKHAAGASWKSLNVVHVHGRVARRVHYDDSGIRWVSYFHGGDALHYIHRTHYGFPQSAGCVEMPMSGAHVMWVGTHIGTLVTVTTAHTPSPSSFHASF